ncbi:MAG: hypothetical protein FWE09_05510, partial [Treponema sp.]|nr:hypothetical protein [Treponema sp.]
FGNGQSTYGAQGAFAQIDGNDGTVTIPPNYDWKNYPTFTVKAKANNDKGDGVFESAPITVLEPVITGATIDFESGYPTSLNRNNTSPASPRVSTRLVLNVTGDGHPQNGFDQARVEWDAPDKHDTTTIAGSANGADLSITGFQKGNALSVTAAVKATTEASASYVEGIAAKTVPLSGDELRGAWYRVAVGGDHGMAISKDGHLYTWGRNRAGQLGLGYNDLTAFVQTPTLVEMQTGGYADDWRFISGGQWHSVAINEEGQLFAWGSNFWGQLGTGADVGSGDLENDSTSTSNINSRANPVDVAGIKWATASAGYTHTLAITEDGELYAWGSNVNGKLGVTLESGNRSAVPLKVTVEGEEGLEWEMASAGRSHSAAITTDGRLFVWGQNNQGQIGNGGGADVTVPTEVKAEGVEEWVFVAAAEQFTAALDKDGRLWTWGVNGSGELGESGGASGSRNVPGLATSVIGIEFETLSMASNASHVVALTKDGDLITFGRNNFGQLGNGDTDNSYLPVWPDVGSGDFASVQGGSAFTLAIEGEDGDLYGWGSNRHSEMGQPSNDPVMVLLPTQILHVPAPPQP